MKTETFDLELITLTQTRKEQILLTENQLVVLGIVARAMDQTVSEYITETILSMLECELDDTLPLELKKKLGNREVLQS